MINTEASTVIDSFESLSLRTRSQEIERPEDESFYSELLLFEAMEREEAPKHKVLVALDFGPAQAFGWSLSLDSLSDLQIKHVREGLGSLNDASASIEQRLTLLGLMLESVQQAGGRVEANFASDTAEILRRLATLSLLQAVETGLLPDAKAMLWAAPVNSPKKHVFLKHGEGVMQCYAQNPNAIVWVDLGSSAISAEYLALVARATSLAPVQTGRLFSVPSQQLQGAVPRLWMREGGGSVLEVPTLQQHDLETVSCLRYLRVALGPQVLFTKHCVDLTLVEHAWNTLTSNSAQDISSSACILAGLFEQSLLQAQTWLRLLERSAREQASPLSIGKAGDELVDARQLASLAEAKTYLETVKEALLQFKAAEGDPGAEVRKPWFSLFDERLNALSLMNELIEKHLENVLLRRREAQKVQHESRQLTLASVENSFKEECLRFGLLGTVTKLLFDSGSPLLNAAGTLLMAAGAGYYAWRLNKLIAERRESSRSEKN